MVDGVVERHAEFPRQIERGPAQVDRCLLLRATIPDQNVHQLVGARRILERDHIADFEYP